ncbi:hypothetical protein [Nonomuraea helvata]|uniref:Lipoprotein n=1 Tax=Nonomuraea helvata TaxID=37484 RepID=A0ABV5SG47_9ACTN
MNYSLFVRFVVVGVAAVGLTLTASACGGGGVDKAGLVTKLSADEDFKGLPANVMECMADLAMKYGDKDDLQSYMDGKIKKVDEVKGLGQNDKEAEADAEKCTKLVKQ